SNAGSAWGSREDRRLVVDDDLNVHVSASLFELAENFVCDVFRLCRYRAFGVHQVGQCPILALGKAAQEGGILWLQFLCSGLRQPSMSGCLSLPIVEHR